MKRHTTKKVENASAEVGEYIRTWRKIYELKASQVAPRAGISLGTLRKIEQGDSSVGLTAFLEVLRSLGLLDMFTKSLDSLETDIGRARVSENMPKRIRG